MRVVVGGKERLDALAQPGIAAAGAIEIRRAGAVVFNVRRFGKDVLDVHARALLAYPILYA
jgi:hypothetical protein